MTDKQERVLISILGERKGQLWTLIWNLRTDGFTFREISQEVNKDVHHVHTIYKKMKAYLESWN